MFRYKLDNNIEKTIPEINLVVVKLNNSGFADLLSNNLELLNDLKYAKNKINQINSFLWEDLKKYTNPYELIYAFSNRNGWESNRSVADIKPLSRSFFKMIEMIYEFAPILLELDLEKLVSLHIAEGPGGFIEATRYLRSLFYSTIENDICFGITLIDNDTKCVPAWKQSGFFLRNNPNVIISTGADGTGNIYKPENIKYLTYEIKEKIDKINKTDKTDKTDETDKDFKNKKDDTQNQEYKFGYCNFITADGGFDYSIDYNYQEQASSKLLFSQILCSLSNQAKDGIFICKMFDMNLYISIEMIYILYMCYDEVILFKPYTSRIANSEKYLICRGFNGVSKDFLNNLYQVLEKWNKDTSLTINQLFDEIPTEFIKQVININKKIVYEQIKVINSIMNVYYNKLNLNEQWKKENFKKQYELSVEWCKKYKIPYKLLVS
jgi:23S rRNA U2552 (ribose-2'-O)-methylase RlmE/FtsJ